MRIVPRTPTERAMLEVAARLRRENPHLVLVEGGTAPDVPHLRVARDDLDEMTVGLHDGADSFVLHDSHLAHARSRQRPVNVRVVWTAEGAEERQYRDEVDLWDLVDGRDMDQRVTPLLEQWRRARIHVAETRVTHSDARFREVRALLFTALDGLPPLAAARVRQVFGIRRMPGLRLEVRYEEVFMFGMDPDTRRLVEVQPCSTRDPASATFAAWAKSRSRLHCEMWGRTWSWAEEDASVLQCLDVQGPQGSTSLEPNEDVASVALVRLRELRTMPPAERRPATGAEPIPGSLLA